MIIGIVGLGLIGGSFAKAYKRGGHTVLAADTDKKILQFAAIDGDLDGELARENLKDCDLILLCVYPGAALTYLKENGPYFGKKPVVIDCCGTKRVIVSDAMKLAHEYGFTYAGGHPMAGRQYSGFKYSRADMYDGAPMVIVPEDFNDIAFLSRVKTLLEPAGFGSISVTTAEKHDEMIAFTSQLAHVVSNAYIKSPTAGLHKGFSAGSYRDMTRVAWLNPDMWTELFFENKDNLLKELDILMNGLQQYKDALISDDREMMKKLLADGKKRKEEIDSEKNI
jgi:prephenate dehydrogenase